MEYASQDMLDKWLAQIPAGRFASPYELKGVRSNVKVLSIAKAKLSYSRLTYFAHRMPLAT